jgi:hypothetical protein
MKTTPEGSRRLQEANHRSGDQGGCQVLAVLNDQIRPTINIQNKRNKQTYSTYTFTINIFSHYWILSVLQDIYMKYMGSMVKVRKSESVKQILQKAQ